MRNRELFEQFQKVEEVNTVYSDLSGSGFVRKIKRFFLLRELYLLYICARIGFFKKDVRTRLFFGKNIKIPLTDFDAARLYFWGALGSEENSLTKYLIRNLKSDDVFYDIGANFGFYTFLAAHIVTEGEIHSFEPDKNVFRYLENNKTESSIFLNNVAVGNKTETIDFFSGHNAKKSGKSTIVDAVAEASKYSFQKKRVPCITLEEYIKEHIPPTIMKLDVEGAEWLVLDGCSKILLQYKPIIIIEVWGDTKNHFSQSALSLLREHEYNAHRIESDGSLCRLDNDPTSFMHSDNYVFIHRENSS